jgi:hypothetical protein
MSKANLAYLPHIWYPWRILEPCGQAVMGTHSFIRYFDTVTVTVTSLVTAVTNEFLFSSAFNEVTEAIEDLKND